MKQSTVSLIKEYLSSLKEELEEKYLNENGEKVKAHNCDFHDRSLYDVDYSPRSYKEAKEYAQEEIKEALKEIKI